MAMGREDGLTLHWSEALTPTLSLRERGNEGRGQRGISNVEQGTPNKEGARAEWWRGAGREGGDGDDLNQSLARSRGPSNLRATYGHR